MPAAAGTQRSHRVTANRPAAQVTRNLFRGLVAIGRDFDIEPDLAERFTVSDDGRSYRFTLRRDARWSDGAPVTADDFAFTFAQMAEDEVATAFWLDGVSASALDERTLEIRLREPRNHFLYLLGQPSALRLAAARLRARRDRRGTAAIPLVGNGPFVLTEPRREPRRAGGRPDLARGARKRRRGGDRARSLTGGSRRPLARRRIRRPRRRARRAAPSPTTRRSCSARPGCSRGISASTRGGRRSTTPASAVPSRTRSTGTRGGGAACEAPRPPRAGCFRRRCPATRTASLRHSTRTVPAPSSARRATPTDVPSARSCWHVSRLWEDAASDVAAQLEAVGVRVRLLAATSDPDLDAAIDEKRAHAYIWA